MLNTVSTGLKWRPAVPLPDAEQLAYELKRALGRRLWGHDGSLHGDDQEVGSEFVPYLEGLVDAGLTSAQDLIDAIERHGRVIIWIS